MSQKIEDKKQEQKNYLLLIKNQIRKALKEGKNLTIPTPKETLVKTLFILVVCLFMMGFLILVGELVVKLFSLII